MTIQIPLISKEWWPLIAGLSVIGLLYFKQILFIFSLQKISKFLKIIVSKKSLITLSIVSIISTPAVMLCEYLNTPSEHFNLEYVCPNEHNYYLFTAKIKKGSKVEPGLMFNCNSCSLKLKLKPSVSWGSSNRGTPFIKEESLECIQDNLENQKDKNKS